jgi:hypothetical protein
LIWSPEWYVARSTNHGSSHYAVFPSSLSHVPLGPKISSSARCSPALSMQGWRTYGTRAQNGMRKGFLGTRRSQLSQLCSLNFSCPTSFSVLWTYVYIHIPDCVETVYELPLLPNNIASDVFLQKSTEVRSVDRIFTTGAPAWRWLGEYMTLDKTFYSLSFFNSSSYFQIFFLIAFLEEAFIRNVVIIIYINCIIIIFNNNNNNNNNSVINSNCGRVQDLTLLFKTPIDTRKIFFEIYVQFVHAPWNISPTLHQRL